jgi:hypothetical protein
VVLLKGFDAALNTSASIGYGNSRRSVSSRKVHIPVRLGSFHHRAPMDEANTELMNAIQQAQKGISL